MIPLLHKVQLLLSHAESCRKVLENPKDKGFGRLTEGICSIIPFIFCSLATSFFASSPYDVWMTGLAALILGHSYLTKKHHGKGRLHRLFGHKEAVRKQKVMAPSFQSSKPGEQVCELIAKITPKPEHVQAVDSLTESIHNIISEQLLLDVEVIGYSYANPFVDVPLARVEPEISVVVNIDLVKYHMGNKDDLKQHKKSDSPRQSASKDIIRRIKKCLVSKHGFKLRRSIFTDSARVMLNVPVQHGSLHERCCIQIACSNTLPICGVKIVAFCNKFHPLASALVLLVQHWTRWRALCLVDSGDCSLYAWAILAVFYLQVHDEKDFPFLPPFDENAKGAANESSWDNVVKDPLQLFTGFFGFYSQSFDFLTEVVSVSRGRRSQRTHPSHSALCIEDPFDAEANLASTMTKPRVKLLKQEIQRAYHLCSSGASLTDLLVFPADISE